MRKTVSWLEIGVGLGLVALSGSLFVYDWVAALICSPEDMECASWAFLILGFYVGIPTLIVGLVTLRLPRAFWYGQALQVLFVCYLVAIPFIYE